jgi:hypothetical protein
VIDRSARDRLAEGLRQFAAGRSWSEDFEQRCVMPAMRSPDPGAHEVAWAAWGLYDDFSDTRLTGRFRLSRESRRAIARWIMFLRSDTAYEWPTYPRWHALALLPMDILTLGATARARRRKWRKAGEFHVWPYRTWSDYRTAIRTPVYLQPRPASGNTATKRIFPTFGAN